MGKIEVYHLERTPELRTSHEDLYFNATFTGDKEAVQTFIEKGFYTKVADIKTSNLDVAYHLSNTITQYWGKNEEVDLYKAENRSTSVGDVFLQDGQLFVVEREGFLELDNGSIEHLKSGKVEQALPKEEKEFNLNTPKRRF